MSVRKTPNSDNAQAGAEQDEKPLLAMPSLMTPFLGAGAMLGLEAVTAGMQNWRRMMDTARSLMRMQQDAMLEIARAQCSGRYAASIPHAEAVNTLQDAAKVYERVGEAWLQAQRAAFETVAHPDDVHH